MCYRYNYNDFILFNNFEAGISVDWEQWSLEKLWTVFGWFSNKNGESYAVITNSYKQARAQLYKISFLSLTVLFHWTLQNFLYIPRLSNFFSARYAKLQSQWWFIKKT